MLIIRKTIPFYVSIVRFLLMMKLFRWRNTLPFLLVVMLIGSCLIVGCASKTVSIQTIPPPTTSKITIQTAIPSPTDMKGTVSSLRSFIEDHSLRSVDGHQIKRGQDIQFEGIVQGGAKSLTITVLFVCEDPTNCPNAGCERRGTCTHVTKVIVPVNADTSYSINVSTIGYKTGEYRGYLELPTGENTFNAFEVVDT